MGEVGLDALRRLHRPPRAPPRRVRTLFNTILINVTGFFRDRGAGSTCADDGLPQLLRDGRRTAPIRVWCAGCASGEEAYTVAMVLAEALGEERVPARVKIYATDVDEEALDQARQARTRASAGGRAARAALERYFERGRPALHVPHGPAAAVIFGRNDLVQDAPISRIDLLVCRNTLMYFNAETQARILAASTSRSTTTGFLFLGKSEMLITHADLFAPHGPQAAHLPQGPARRRARPRSPSSPMAPSAPPDGGCRRRVARRRRFDLTPGAQIVVDRDGRPGRRRTTARARCSGSAARTSGGRSRTWSSPTARWSCASALERGRRDGQPCDRGGVRWTRAGGQRARSLDVASTPLARPTASCSARR